MRFQPTVVFSLLSCAFCTAALPGSVDNTSHEVVKRVPTGFVYRSGTEFMLDGKPFFFAGTNAYWATGMSSGDLTSLFSQMNAAGLKVLRIFAWSDNVGSPNNSNLQSWSGTTNTPNPSAFAAQMDPIINAATAAGIKLVIPMIGNWGPSVSLYIQQWEGSGGKHDDFYSNSNIVNAYKKYVNFFVNRYKSSAAVFAWELMNEPRCTGDDNRGQSANCDNAMITNWISTMSSYIKGIDPNHMVTVGDEGWFTTAQGYGSSYPYSGTIGIDWVANLKISTIDYGTVHLYPDSWGQTLDWGNTWITQHADQAKSIGKPVVLEEFGTTNTGSRQSTIQGWLNSALSSGYAGAQYWQFVASFPSGYKSPDDGNGISTSEATFSVVKSFASSMNSKDGGSSGVTTTTTHATTTAQVKTTTTQASTGGGSCSAHYGQCGGQGWTGATCCVSGTTCQYSNAYYSQCL